MQPESPEALHPPGRAAQCLVIRARRIEWVVPERSGAARQWRVQAGMDIANADGLPSMAALLETLAALPQPNGQARQCPVRAIVADVWLPSVTIPWSDALLRGTTALAHARAQLLAAGFELADGDLIRMDAAPFGAPRLVVAYPQALLSALQEWALRVGVRLVSVLPLMVAAWRLVPRQTGTQALALCDGASISIAHGFARSRLGAGCIAGLSVRDGGDPLMADALAHTWQRLCLREPALAGAASVAVLDLSGSGDAEPGAPFVPIKQAVPAIASRLDAASDGHALAVQGKRASWTPWQWSAVTVMAVACIALLVQTADTVSKTHAMQARLAQIDRSRQAVLPAKRWSREEIIRIQSINRAIRALNLPIDALLDALVPPRDIRVAVLAMETVGQGANVPAQSSAIKLLAQACSAADMARYVAFVSVRRPFHGAYLTRHEIAENSGNCPYRFTVEAQWSESTQ